MYMFSFLRKKRVYLDNASGTKMSDLALRTFIQTSKLSGNISSIHKEGVALKHIYQEAKKIIGDILSCQPHELYFTGNGTESINLAIVGTYHYWKKTHPGKQAHIITSAIEHPAVLETVHT